MLWVLRRSQWDWQQGLVRLTWSPAWLPIWPLPALDGRFHWPHGAFYFIILAGWLQLYTHKCLWNWLKNPLHSISRLFHLLSLARQGPMQGALSLYVAALSLEREHLLWCLRILCELKHRTKTEKWVLGAPNNISDIVHKPREPALDLLHELCPASPCTHTHKPLSSPFPGMLKQQQVCSHGLGGTEIQMEPRFPQGPSHDSTKSTQR